VCVCVVRHAGTAGGDLVELTAMDRAFFSPAAAAAAGGRGGGGAGEGGAAGAAAGGAAGGAGAGGEAGGGRGKIPIGSVKSNVGHCEAASGLVSIIKVCLAYRHQCLPANLHFHHPRQSIRDLLEDKFAVVTENTPWRGGVAGVSSYGFGGVCAHLVLAGGPEGGVAACQAPDAAAECAVAPKCGVYSARTVQSLQALSAFVCREYRARPLPLSLSSTASLCSREHPYRGFVMQQQGEGEGGGGFVVVDNATAEGGGAVCEEVWWVFTGMGAHWTRMGESHLHHLRTHPDLLSPNQCPIAVILFQALRC
jgi:acyl transferase domain-containing protein